ncbi:MAG: hypothetical protein ONB48_03480 [candidate division KSB1 bacterium]|nr:hypothetical protein [candidate division KSB1 bacterium]MDZ7275599.1 hypothetical protein [candidate division KSB1 bacterium]MDZ7284710.1 hypothetical protein [candidate division KSB1 bacterium]MDZ7297871.1 hypothetical protein [candidate division KSB1 bacterium]MDZ7306001.1 hypothetical protein [candidate division KSB1 bacterium]
MENATKAELPRKKPFSWESIIVGGECDTFGEQANFAVIVAAFSRPSFFRIRQAICGIVWRRAFTKPSGACRPPERGLHLFSEFAMLSG